MKKILRKFMTLGTAAVMLGGVCCAPAQMIVSAAPADDTADDEQIIYEIKLTGVSTPAVGGNPVYTGIKPGDPEMYQLVDANAGDYRIGGVSWSGQTSAYDRTMLLSTSEFIAEKCYTLSVLVEPVGDAQFPPSTADVTATVNGNPAKVAKHADFPDALYISYTYKGTASSIGISGIAEPQAGAAPVYSARPENPMQAAITDPDGGEVGVSWAEVIDGKAGTEAPEEFELGKTYRVTVCVGETDYFRFADTDKLTASINGYAASVQEYLGGTVGLVCDFTVGGQRGDADGDGTVSVADAQTVLAYYVEQLAGQTEGGESKIDTDACDVDANETISVEDAQYILLFYTENTLAGTPTGWNEVIRSAAQDTPADE